jgi:hypothetical protein
MMPFAKLGPDRKHALEAQRRDVGFPGFGFDRLRITSCSPFPNWFQNALAA